MFSIIIPLYNKEKTIAKTIVSVLAQSFSEFELIIVDDGSTDKSLNIVEQIQDDRIKVITQMNSGVSVARNRGAQSSTFEYLAFLDADDWWDNSFLYTMYGLIQDYPKAMMYGARFRCVYSQRNIIPISSNIVDVDTINYFQLYLDNRESPIHTSSAVIRKMDFLELKGFNTKLKQGEDIDLWMRLATRGEIIYTNTVLSNYNQLDCVRNRASCKLYARDEAFIFNLEQFATVEENNVYCKKLLDYLRVRWCKPYYISNQYIDDIKSILSQVKQIPFVFRLFYSCPPIISSFIYKLYLKFK